MYFLIQLEETIAARRNRKKKKPMNYRTEILNQVQGAIFHTNQLRKRLRSIKRWAGFLLDYLKYKNHSILRKHEAQRNLSMVKKPNRDSPRLASNTKHRVQLTEVLDTIRVSREFFIRIGKHNRLRLGQPGKQNGSGQYRRLL